MRQCPNCGSDMVRWGHGRTERWRCPPCTQKRRKKRHNKVEIVGGAPLQETPEPRVILEDTDLTLFNGDCLDVLAELPDKSVHMCATSPPFWSLRDYQTEGQIGLEDSVDQWVERLCDVFDEVKRVLRDDGTLWCEIGDSFDTKQLVGQPWRLAFALQERGWFLRSEIIWARPNPMPESVSDRPTKAHSTVFLLSKSYGYFFDQDAIRERFSDNTHSRGKGIGVKGELVQEGGTKRAGRNNADFQRATQTNLAKLSRPPQVETLDGLPPEAPRGPDGRLATKVKGGENSEQHRDGERWPNPAGANTRSVWTIATEPTPFAHFATFPRELVRRMILAGTSEKGCCPECGAPWVRMTERGELIGEDRGGNYQNSTEEADAGMVNRFKSANEFRPGMHYERIPLGWKPSCEHQGAPVPAVVLDPFAGSGTTLLVARSLGRHSVGIELNKSYCDLVAERTQQLSLLA